MTSRRCCCGCNCECTLCSGSDYTSVCCWTLYIRGVKTGGAPTCASCPPDQESTLCVVYTKLIDASSSGSSQSSDCEWGLMNGSGALCGTGANYEDYRVTLTGTVGSDIILTVTTASGGEFTLNLGANPDCCITSEQQLSVVSFPGWDCDFSGATAFIKGDDFCIGCGASINYSGWLQLANFVTPDGECGCHDPRGGCETLNGRLVPTLSGSSFTKNACPGSGWYESSSFDAEGPGPLSRDHATGTIVIRDDVCGFYGFFFNKTLTGGSLDAPYTGALSFRLEALICGGTAGYGVSYYERFGQWAYYFLEMTIPETWMSGHVNRASEYFRLFPQILPFDSWENGKVDCTETSTPAREHECIVEDSYLIYYMQFGSTGADGFVTNDFPWDSCEPAWCHENGLWEEMTVTLPAEMYTYVAADQDPTDPTKACPFPAIDYILTNATVSCFHNYEQFEWDCEHPNPNNPTINLWETHGFNMTVTLLEVSNDAYKWQIDVELNGSQYNPNYVVERRAYRFLSTNTFSLPKCTNANSHDDIDCSLLIGQEFEVACWGVYVYNPWSNGGSWTSCSLSSSGTSLTATLELTSLAQGPVHS